MASPSLSRWFPSLALSLSALAATAMIAAPLFAQQQGRISRECRQEVVKLCGRDRSKIPSCLQERASELSEACKAEVRERMGQGRGRPEQQRKDGERQTQRPYQAPTPVTQSILYGSHIRQQVNIYKPDDAVDDLPVILFVHGGGWSMGDNQYVQRKPGYYTDAGYIFASTGYRLIPEVAVEDQAADVGAAVRALVGQASAVGIDAERIVIMGHSAGAHLAALVASDPSYAGDAFSAIKGVVLLDGGGYDIATHMSEARPRSWQVYDTAFGNNPARQAALSPVTHVGGKDAPNWLALYVEERDISRKQAQVLVNGLIEAGASASAMPILDTDHSRMSRELGTEAGAQQTEVVDAFLAMVFEREFSAPSPGS